MKSNVFMKTICAILLSLLVINIPVTTYAYDLVPGEHSTVNLGETYKLNPSQAAGVHNLSWSIRSGSEYVSFISDGNPGQIQISSDYSAGGKSVTIVCSYSYEKQKNEWNSYGGRLSPSITYETVRTSDKWYLQIKSVTTPQPIITATPKPTTVPTPIPSVVPTVEPTPEPTLEPIYIPDPESSVAPVVEPTPVPTSEPFPEPTPEPSLEPIFIPDPEPSATPVVEPTPVPTIESSPEPALDPIYKPEPDYEPIYIFVPESTPESTANPIFVPVATPQITPAVLPEDSLRDNAYIDSSSDEPFWAYYNGTYKMTVGKSMPGTDCNYTVLDTKVSNCTGISFTYQVTELWSGSCDGERFIEVCSDEYGWNTLNTKFNYSGYGSVVTVSVEWDTPITLSAFGTARVHSDTSSFNYYHALSLVKITP